MRARVIAVVVLLLCLVASPAAAAVTIVQDPTLVSATASSVTIDFDATPTVGNKIVVAFAATSETTVNGNLIFQGQNITTASQSVADNQGGSNEFVPTGGRPTATPAGEYHPSTTIAWNSVGITHTTVSAATGSYSVTVTVTGATRVVVKAWEIAGTPPASKVAGVVSDPSAPSDAWLTAYYPLGADSCGTVGGNAYHGGVKGNPSASAITSFSTCPLVTTATAFIVAAVRIQNPTSLAHSNTGGGWTRCTGCPLIDDGGSKGVVGFDVAYRLNAPAGTYSDAWTFSSAVRDVRSVIVRFDAAP